MPAMRAMPNTSPFFAEPDLMCASVEGSISILPLAVARRWVAGLVATSTICAWPWASKWVKLLIIPTLHELVKFFDLEVHVDDIFESTKLLARPIGCQ